MSTSYINPVAYEKNQLIVAQLQTWWSKAENLFYFGNDRFRPLSSKWANSNG